ncbi:MAG: Fic family protein [Bacteroidota bacterium]
MPQLQDLLNKINSLHAQLERLKPLKREDEERLWKKFRLEWNYNSNHIEGNTLTYGQTELLIFFGKTTGDHDIREYREMQAHDVALKMIVEYASDKSRELIEADIRELNKIILVEPYWGNAQTANGQPTRKLITPGEYKKEPNSVLLQNGEMFHYASPEDTPAMMKELLEWYNDSVKQKKLHPVEIAALIHYKFVRIHPFDDSNGRTSRLLMNYVLLRFGYPPVIIRSTDKKNYLNALNKADVGDVNAFVEYVTKQLTWSFELSVKAASSEDIEELDDVEKEIALWKKNKQVEVNEALKQAGKIKDLYAKSIKALFLSFLEKLNQSFGDSFNTQLLYYSVHLPKGRTQQSDIVSKRGGAIETEKASKLLTEIHGRIFAEVLGVSISIEFQNLKNNVSGKSVGGISTTLKILFDTNEYKVLCNNQEILVKTHDDPFTQDDFSTIINRCLKITFEAIKKFT